MTVALNSKKIFPRLMGALIIYRTVAPVIIIMMTAFILYYIPAELNRIGNETVDSIKNEHLEPLSNSIKEVQAEVKRINGEVKKAQKVVAGVNAEFKRALSPVYTAISALYVSLRGLQNVTQTVVYAILDAINALPGIHIKKPRFPRIQIDLPKLNLKAFKIDIMPDLAGLEEMKRISKEVGAELNTSAKAAGETFSFGWKWVKMIILLFAAWVLVFCVTIAEGMWRNVARGWKMLLGQQANETD